MPILQKKINDDFTVVHNTFIRDKNLGISARGLLLTMLSMKDGWHFSIKGLASILPDGEKKVSSALKSLEKSGYLRRDRIYENGKVKEWVYSFSDEPVFNDDTSYDLHRQNVDVGFEDVGKLDKENRHGNKILNNQIPNNQILSNKSVNQSANSETVPSKSDGQTDGTKESMTFSQVLSEIGLDTNEIGFVPKSENDLQEFDESDRSTSNCKIPYSLKTNKKAMKESLKFLFAHSYYSPTIRNDSKRLLCTVINVIAEMTAKDIQEYQGQKIKYYEVIDRLNDIIHGSDGSLFDWFNSFELQWAKILAEHTIKHQKAYMKSCIWNWLNDYAFEDDNDLRKLNYNLKQGVI